MNYLIPGEKKLEGSPVFKCVGRDEELRAIASVLTRKHSNSIIITGPGGVGCTTICLGLQAWKEQKGCPFDIAVKRVFWMDSDGLFSSGDSAVVSAEFLKIISALENTTESILIIEDYTDFINAARSGGYDHFINALMSVVKSKKSQMIFEVKDDSFDVAIKSHSDMIELFTVIDVKEPGETALTSIVSDICIELGGYHSIAVDPSAIEAAISLTTKYRVSSNRAQPTRSINLIDSALSSFRMEKHALIVPEDAKLLEEISIEMRNLEDHSIKLNDELITEDRKMEENAGEQRKSLRDFTKLMTGGGVDTEEKRAIKSNLRVVEDQISEIRSRYEETVVRINRDIKLTKGEVTAEFARLSGIPAEKLNQDEREKLRNLEAALLKRIFGQEHAMKHLANMVKTSRIGRRNTNAPMGSCMFLGPSGVGKTETAKVLSEYLGIPLFRFDMSEYMEKHATAKLIGAPPGYEGFEAGGILTNGIRRTPVCVLLLDEIEKAHSDVFNVFLQILSDGRLTDNVGRVISFQDVYVICTTNIGQEHYLNPKINFDKALALTMMDLDKTYRPEFLNRFGGRKDIIPFSSLGVAVIEKIVNRELDSIASAYTKENIFIGHATDEIHKFCEKNYDPRTGARGLPGHLRSTLEPLIADMALDKETEDKLALSIVYDKKTCNLIVHKEG